MKQTASPLLPLFEARNASVEEIGGQRVAARVTDSEGEYRAARQKAALFDRWHRTRLRVGGSDAESFLHNMLTTDVKKLGMNRGRPALFLTNKGKVIADFLLLRVSDGFLIDVEACRSEILDESLGRYVISEDVTVEEVEDAGFSIEGPLAAEMLGRSLGSPSPQLLDREHLEIVSLSFESSPVRIVVRRRSPSFRFDVFAEQPTAIQLLEALLGSKDPPTLAGHLVAETRRIESFEPRFGFDLDGTQFPQEAALDDAVSFDKGCYIGQEYVVRLAHRGQIAKRLSGVLLPGNVPPPRSAEVRVDAERVGELTSCTYSPGMASSVALAYLKRGFFEPGQAVVIAETGGALRPGQVASLPFGDSGT